MTRKKARTSNAPSPSLPVSPSPAPRFVAWLVALLVARWLVPTEASAEGMTLWLTTLVLFTALVNAALAWRFDERRPRFDAIDGSIWLLIAAQAISALVVVFTVGNQRAAINVAWEWIGSGVLIWLLRRQLTSARVVRELCVGLSLTAAVLAGYGLWQHYVWYPQMVREYQRLTNEVDSLTKKATGAANVRPSSDDSRRLTQQRAEMARQGIPSEEPARTLWEQRLKSSREPFGLFALANTFAGLVMVAVLIQLGSLVTEWPVRHQRWPVLVCLFAGFGVTAFCLLLTKSRSAWAGLFAGLVWWGLRALMATFAARRLENSGLRTQNSVLSTRTSPEADLKQSPAARRSSLVTWVVVGLLVVGAAVTFAAVSGGLDRQVLSEAPKSLRYRIEYWRGTWETIREHFWLGTGSGNFRDHYLKHKLPESSEEIVDPHNLVLDVWANAGVLGLIGLLACVALMARTWLRPMPLASGGCQAPDVSEETRQRFTSSAVWGAGLAFPLVAIGLELFGYGTDERLWWLGAIWWFLWMGLEPITRFVARTRSAGQRVESRTTRVPRSHFGLASMLEAANVALFVHLLGAGGIAMPAITQLFWLVWVMRAALSDRKGDASNESSSSMMTLGGVNAPRVWLSLTGGAAVLLGLCLMSATLPELSCRTYLAVGDAILTDGQDVAVARNKYEAAVNADRFAIEPRERLAELTFEQSRQSRRVADRDEAARRQRAVIDRMPFASRPWRRLGQMWMTWFRQTRDPEHARSAAEAFAAAVERYPHHAGLLAEWATAASEAGLTEQAGDASRRALRQDDLNHQAGHLDKFLGKDDRLRIERLADDYPATQRRSDAN